MKSRIALFGALALLATTTFAARPAQAGIFDTIKGWFQKAGEFVKTTGEKIGQEMRTASREVAKAFGDVTQKVKNAVEKAAHDALDLAKKAGKGVAKEALHGPFLGYILLNRRLYLNQAKPLTDAEKNFLKPFFPQRLIDKVRVADHQSDTGFFNKKAGATTYGNDFIIIKKGNRNNTTLKHEMTHVCQYDKFGLRGFAYRYADQFVDGGFSYMNIEFEKQAYSFQKPGTATVGSFLHYCNQ
jgi:hypothetical protein